MEQYKLSLQTYLGAFAKSLRLRSGLSQERMAELLRITARSYSDLERRQSCFSTQTFLFLLFLLPEDEMLQLLRNLRALLDEVDHAAV